MPSITIRIDEATSEQVDELASAMERSRSWVAGAALKRYLKEEQRWLEDIRVGMAELDRGEGIAHEDVMSAMRAKIAQYEAQAQK